jgi:hypothetical protein
VAANNATQNLRLLAADSDLQLTIDWLAFPKSELCYDWRLVSRPVLVSYPYLGPKTRFLLLSDSCSFVDVGCPLWREDGSVIYDCCWSSPAQSFFGASPVRLSTYFTVSDLRLPNLEGQIPVFTSPRNRMAQLYRQTLGSLVITSYNSQGYSGGIQTHFHAGPGLAGLHYIM